MQKGFIDATADIERKAIKRLMDKAQRIGLSDSFLAKRAELRYALVLEIDATTDRSDPYSIWPVSTHNISKGGIGFWSKRSLPLDKVIYVREYSSNNQPSVWIPARVKHCTVGIQGHLVGAAFLNPLSSQSGASLDAGGAGLENEDGYGESNAQAMERTLPSIKAFRQKWTFLLVTIVAIAIGLDVVIFNSTIQLPKHILLLLAIGSDVLMLVIGYLLGQQLERKEVKFFRELLNTIQEMTETPETLSALPQAPFQELNEVCKGIHKLGHNLQERENNERIRRQRLEELSQIKSNILSIVSHDLRTPLTSILLYARMLSDELTSLEQEEQRRFLEIISGECTRLSSLVDEILEVQRLESGRVQWHLHSQDLGEGIRSCAKVFTAMASSKSIQFNVICPESLPPVNADSEKINQVVSNLLSNALKFTPPGGTVSLIVEVKGSELVLKVTDTGPGIPRDKWDEIFEHFTQLSDVNECKGAGLGLYIVKRIVEHHDGTVWVNSVVGQGSEFNVSLPMEKKPAKAALPKGTDSNQKRILVCDPDPEVTALIAQMVQEEGYEAATAHSGCRLLSQLEDANFDVVITEVVLPDIGTLDLLKAFTRLSNRNFQVIAHSVATDSYNLKHYGADVVLRRPATKKELLQALRICLWRQTKGDPVVLVMVGSEVLNLNRFHSLLQNEGYMPMSAGSFKEAEAMLPLYSVNKIVISEEYLAEDWSNISQLQLPADREVSLMVLTRGEPKNKYQQLAGALGISVCAGQVGQEIQVLNALLEAKSMGHAEVCA